MKTTPAPSSAKLRRHSPRGPVAGAPDFYRLELYVTGTSPRSLEAISNLNALCEEHLAGLYNLEVVDLYQEPGRAARAQIVVCPTLVKRMPKPLMRMVGNLSNREQLMATLQLDPVSPVAL